MDDLINVDARTQDEWEDYIREASIENAIIERGKRWYEFHEFCRGNYGKQGGSEFSQFAEERFRISQQTASRWVCIGKYADELTYIISKFAPDHLAFYLYTTLSDEQKQQLLNADILIDQKAIKNLTYGHIEGDEWYTPEWIFDALGLIFSIDVCSPIDRTHAKVPAKEYYTEENDGLNLPWKGTIWCNPPYSNPEPWALKCVKHGDGLLLTHIPMNAQWCVEVWHNCDGIRLFQAIEFIRPDGKLQRPGHWLQLTSFGQIAREALSNLKAPYFVAENPRRIPSPMWIKNE